MRQNSLVKNKDSSGSLVDFRRGVDRLFDDFWSPVSGATGRGDFVPACDVEDAGDHFLLTVEVPVIAKEDINIEVRGNCLVVSGERRASEKKKRDGGWYSERSYGSFHRSFALPQGTDAEKIEAGFKDGLLEFAVPKAEAVKPREIRISDAGGGSILRRLTGRAEKSSHDEAEKLDPEKQAQRRKVNIA